MPHAPYRQSTCPDPIAVPHSTMHHHPMTTALLLSTPLPHHDPTPLNCHTIACHTIAPHNHTTTAPAPQHQTTTRPHLHTSTAPQHPSSTAAHQHTPAHHHTTIRPHDHTTTWPVPEYFSRRWCISELFGSGFFLDQCYILFLGKKYYWGFWKYFLSGPVLNYLFHGKLFGSGFFSGPVLDYFSRRHLV